MKNIFIKSTIILVIGGFFTKVIGLLTKIVLTRMIGTTGIGLYSMIIPTLLLYWVVGDPLNINRKKNSVFALTLRPLLFHLNQT